MSMAAAENDRRIANAIQIGTVMSVNGERGRARVRLGDIETAEIHVMQFRAGNASFWWMPAEGEQVVVACPSGDIAQGIIMGGLFAGNAPSSDAANPTIDLGGGTLFVIGNIHVTGEVTANGIALSAHIHGGTMPGGGTTGDPE